MVIFHSYVSLPEGSTYFPAYFGCARGSEQRTPVAKGSRVPPWPTFAEPTFADTSVPDVNFQVLCGWGIQPGKSHHHPAPNQPWILRCYYVLLINGIPPPIKQPWEVTLQPCWPQLSYGFQDLRNHLRTRWAWKNHPTSCHGRKNEKIIPSPETMVIHMGISWLWEYRG